MLACFANIHRCGRNTAIVHHRTLVFLSELPTRPPAGTSPYSHVHFRGQSSSVHCKSQSTPAAVNTSSHDEQTLLCVFAVSQPCDMEYSLAPLTHFHLCCAVLQDSWQTQRQANSSRRAQLDLHGHHRHYRLERAASRWILLIAQTLYTQRFTEYPIHP